MQETGEKIGLANQLKLSCLLRAMPHMHRRITYRDNMHAMICL